MDYKNYDLIFNLNKEVEKIKMILPTTRVNQNWIHIPLPAPAPRAVGQVQAPPVKPAQSAHKDTHTDLQHEQCSICMDNKKCVFFTSCGHVVSCWSCSDKLVQCPQCRKAIADKLMAFI
jgi:hypothetical protein